ncbi:hypothetical protein WA538_000017 [Blastocystis sp. DL]
MSRNIPIQVIQKLQSNPNHVRNICILAHVDHGKTTLADGLISSNGIISTRLAGEIRYMDNLEEEQKRGITMKSSSISLFFEDDTTITDEATAQKVTKKVPYLINLVDSPGHIDFSSDVSAAVRLCDGCLVVVDAIEGVCTQTLTVIQQAFQEGVKPILIINKIDRLIVHLKQTPLDAYQHIRNIIEKVNAYISSLYTAEVISNTATTSYVIDSEKEEQLFVSPANGTVLFASAAHGWCFSLRQFAELYAPLLGINKTKLVKYMWGDYILNAKNKTVSTWTPSSSSSPIFVKYVLSTLWKVYKSVFQHNEEMITTILSTIHVTLTPRELKTTDETILVKLIMSRWLPLYKAVLKTVVKILPSPIAAQSQRFNCIWNPVLCKKIRDGEESPSEETAALQEFKNGFDGCRNDGPLMVYICKLFSVKGCDIVGSNLEQDKEYEIALCRSFSGHITKDTPLFVVPCRNTNQPVAATPVTTPIQLFLLMGREIVAVDEVPAGNIFGIYGLEGAIMKMGTLSDHADCPSLSSLRLASDPIVQIAVETKKPNDIPLLLDQLRILNNNDSSIRVFQMKTGEHIISAVGELQLDVIINDLRKRLKDVELVVSPPIINIRESCDLLPALEEGKERRLPPSVVTTNKLFAKMRVLPIPPELASLLYKASKSQNQLYNSVMTMTPPSGELTLFLQSLQELLEASPLLKPFFPSIAAFGAKALDTNILVVNPALGSGSFAFGRQLRAYYEQFIWKQSESPVVAAPEGDLHAADVSRLLLSHLSTSLVNGFKLACESGPLCSETMWGNLFILEDIFFLPEFSSEPSESVSEEEDKEAEQARLCQEVATLQATTMTQEEVERRIGSIQTGSVITVMKQLCHQAYLQASARIAEPMYRCVLQCSSDQLGKLYSVLNQRRGEVQNEDIWEGTDIFTITCTLPVTESLGLANDLRQQTSGAVNQPQLQFSHWQILDEDPFSKPTTEEEKEEWGESFATRNRAKQIIDSIRKRKGLQTDEKIVENAEKQKTLKNK